MRRRTHNTLSLILIISFLLSAVAPLSAALPDSEASQKALQFTLFLCKGFFAEAARESGHSESDVPERVLLKKKKALVPTNRAVRQTGPENHRTELDLAFGITLARAGQTAAFVPPAESAGPDNGYRTAGSGRSPPLI